jgi:uncharacterized membrane protein
MDFIYHFLVAFLVFAAIDVFWLGIVANKVYKKYVGKLLLDKFLPIPAIIFYIVYIIGLVVFAVQPALTSKSLVEAVWRGALLGFVCYATYDLTNLATLKNWSRTLTIIDLIWGTILSCLVVSITYSIFVK